jgi:hypothetical protein
MAWTLGPLLLEGWSVSPDGSFISTEFESGPPRRKVYSTDETNRLPGNFYLSSATQVQAFWTFWAGEANRGADWFDMPINTQGVSVTHEVRIDSPRITRLGRGYRLTCNIETRERLAS